MMTRDDIEAGADLQDDEIDAAKAALRARLRDNGKLTGCTSYVQRSLTIGYNHATRILDYLEASRFITELDNVGERFKGSAWE